ncbi:hypothetical protein CYMTET_9149, partial [Cymbomonas tetramitiformis]
MAIVPSTVNSAATTLTFTFSATDISEFHCQLDAGPFLLCSSPHTERRMLPGNHTFRVLSTGNTGRRRRLQQAQPPGASPHPAGTATGIKEYRFTVAPRFHLQPGAVHVTTTKPLEWLSQVAVRSSAAYADANGTSPLPRTDFLAMVEEAEEAVLPYFSPSASLVAATGGAVAGSKMNLRVDLRADTTSLAKGDYAATLVVRDVSLEEVISELTVELSARILPRPKLIVLPQ